MNVIYDIKHLFFIKWWLFTVSTIITKSTHINKSFNSSHWLASWIAVVFAVYFFHPVFDTMNIIQSDQIAIVQFHQQKKSFYRDADTLLSQLFTANLSRRMYLTLAFTTSLSRHAKRTVSVSVSVLFVRNTHTSHGVCVNASLYFVAIQIRQRRV